MSNDKEIALVIGASKEALFALHTARAMGYHTIAFDGSAEAEGLKYADESYVVDIRTPQTIIDALGNRLPKVVLPIPIGRYLVTTGAINDHYGLKGCSLKAADVCTDKYLCHLGLAKQGLRSISCILLPKGKTVNEDDLNYPLIFKPRFGSGSRAVSAIFSAEEFRANIKPHMPFDEDFIIEDLVEGDEYGIDAAVINGEFHLVLARKKINTPYPYRQSIGSIACREYNSEKLERHLGKVVQALGIDNCLLNFDIILEGNGDIFIIELAPRPSGHNMHNLFTVYASGVDMFKEFLKHVSSEPYSFRCGGFKTMLMRFFDFQNCVIEQAPDFESIKSEYGIVDYRYNIGSERLATVKDGHSIISRGFVILEGKDEGELLLKSNRLMKEFRLSSRVAQEKGGLHG